MEKNLDNEMEAATLERFVRLILGFEDCWV